MSDTFDVLLGKAENLAYSEDFKDAMLVIIEALKKLRTEIQSVRSDLDSCEGCG